ncbi:FAD-dependent monooxygenase [Nitratireductor sp. XY-223]|uniref:FAD-dependent monooxygenase n=1 Tax=Nitratireductor sp. XY-223 TaxID=2561926 RepID=UPI0010AB111C|nr:FAD-dependent monooxygenase [Nitratireductor sp. XY-223]
MSGEYDVLISGCGPVGAGLAIELGQRGVRVGVVERNLEPPRIPKGQNLTQRTMEHMQAWGVEKAMREAKTIPSNVGLGGLTAYGSLLSGYHYDWFKRAAVRPYYSADNERLPQYETERVLRERLEALDSVDVFYGWKTEALQDHADGASLTARKGDATRTLRGQYLVGCDGARSTVRQTAGIGETLDDHDRLMALVVFRSPEFFKLIEGFRDKQFYNVLHPDNDGYWMFFGMVEWKQSFFFHAPVPADTDRDNFDFKALIRRAVGTDFALDLEYVGFWDLRISVAETYRKGRVFLAGDAAHSHPPYGGYGINTGFEDARNLGWKLAAVLDGWGGETLLDSYDGERRVVFQSTARDFIERFIVEDRAFVRSFDPGSDRAAFETAWAERANAGAGIGISTFAPQYEGSDIVDGPAGGETSAIGIHDFTARPGHHLPPLDLADGSTTLDRLSDGFTLLQLGAPQELTKELQVIAECAGIPLTVVNFAAERVDGDYGHALVLARPDGYVAWAGETLGDAEHLLALVGGRGASGP